MRARHDGDGDDAAMHRRKRFRRWPSPASRSRAAGSGKATRSWRPRSSTKASPSSQTISASGGGSGDRAADRGNLGPRRDHAISATAGSPSMTTSRLDFRRRPVSSKVSVRAQGPAGRAAEIVRLARNPFGDRARRKAGSSGCADKRVKLAVDEAGVDAAGLELRRGDDGGEEREIGLRPGDAGAAERAGQSRPAPPLGRRRCAMTLPSIAS